METNQPPFTHGIDYCVDLTVRDGIVYIDDHATANLIAFKETDFFMALIPYLRSKGFVITTEVL